MDEPSTGLHFADVARLLGVVQRLVDAGNTVLTIEHDLDLIRATDHVLDLGPEGGEAGGYVVVEGTPTEVTAHATSHTGAESRAGLRREAGEAVSIRAQGQDER